MENKFESIKNLVADLEKEADAFYGKRTKVAGTRLRTGLQTLKVLAQECRNDVTAIKNSSK